MPKGCRPPRPGLMAKRRHRAAPFRETLVDDLVDIREKLADVRSSGPSLVLLSEILEDVESLIGRLGRHRLYVRESKKNRLNGEREHE